MWKGAICMPGVVHRNPFPHDTGVTVVVLEQYEPTGQIVQAVAPAAE